MQTGLHLALAAWIKSQRQTDDFFVGDTLPRQIDLVHPAQSETGSDFVKLMEFAEMIDFIPRKGTFAQYGSESLWQTHLELLNSMDFAQYPWDKDDHIVFAAAESLLYDKNSSGNIIGYSLIKQQYDEFASLYYDLVRDNADHTVLLNAQANWISLGNKIVVEDALMTIDRLLQLSSMPMAASERSQLDSSVGGAPGLASQQEFTYARSSFSPLSALESTTWTQAEVEFKELDRMMNGSTYYPAWKTFKAGRSGRISFDFVALECKRSWFTPAIYAADDWRLSDENEVVADGQGTQGQLPAYVNSVYLVRIRKVAFKSVPKVKSTPRSPFSAVRQRAFIPLLKARATAPSKSLSVTRQIGPFRISASTQKKPPLVASRLSSNPTLAVRTGFILLNPRTQIRKLTPVDIKLRLDLASQLLLFRSSGGKKPPPKPSQASPVNTYVVGFGCKQLPNSPNTNPNYDW